MISRWTGNYRKVLMSHSSYPLQRTLSRKDRSLSCLAVPLLLLAIHLAVPEGILAQMLDRFGGRSDVPCDLSSKKWHMEKISERWWICTPSGNAFFSQNVEYIIPTDSTAENRVKAKYGDTSGWSEATLQRLKAWGFNTIGVYSYNVLWPVNTDLKFGTDAKGTHAHAVKLPFLEAVRPAFYSMRNHKTQLWTGGEVQFLDDPVKNILDARSAHFTRYVPPGGIGDYYDAKMQKWMNEDIARDWGYEYIRRGPNNDFLMGFVGDDGDQMVGFRNASDFPSVPPGYNDLNLSLLILSESPVLTASQGLGFLYVDTVMHTKESLRDLLKNKYKTIESLNAAWGSNYTTFDSSGETIRGESVAAGDGISLTFSKVLSRAKADRCSVQVLIDGGPAAGDTGNGAMFGPNVTGEVNYQTGLLQLVFQNGHAPARGSHITVNYSAEGYGSGTGLMDEDMRLSHQAWLGNSWDGLEPMTGSTLKKMTPAVKSDLDVFLKQTAHWYFQMLRDGVHSKFPNALVVAGLGSWSAVPPAPVLQAAAETLDVIEIDETAGTFDQTRMNFIGQNYGDHPILANVFFAANPDSAFGAAPNPAAGGFRTQEEKGSAYYGAVSSLLSAQYPNGTKPHVGIILWSWMDMWGEKTNWGLVSHLDNAYDGRENVSGAVHCSPPLQNLVCGGEPGNYGDYVSKVREANRLWLGIGGQASPTTANKTKN